MIETLLIFIASLLILIYILPYIIRGVLAVMIIVLFAVGGVLCFIVALGMEYFLRYFPRPRHRSLDKGRGIW